MAGAGCFTFLPTVVVESLKWTPLVFSVVALLLCFPLFVLLARHQQPKTATTGTPSLQRLPAKPQHNA